MKRFFLIILFGLSFFVFLKSENCLANEKSSLSANDFLLEMKAKENTITAFDWEDSFKYQSEEKNNKRAIRENLAGGALAFILGTVGYYTSEGRVLNITFSIFQTVGNIQIGHSVYDYLKPQWGSSLTNITQNVLAYPKTEQKEFISKEFVSYYALDDRAKRLSLVTTSSLLSLNFFSNAFLKKGIHRDIQKVYYYLGTVNAIIAAFSFFHRSEYESFYETYQSQSQGRVNSTFHTQLVPVYQGAAMTFSYSF